jgi:serine protease Do
MGVSVTRLDADDAAINGLSRVAGVKVAAFSLPDGGPAKAAGIEVGDVIIAIDGKPVDRVSALQRIVRSHAVGETVNVDALRYGTKKSFKVKLVPAEEITAVASAATPAPVPAPVSGKLGFSVEPLTADLARQMGLPEGKGVRVSDVAQDGPARDKLAPGFVILEVLYPTPRKAIRSVDDLQAVVKNLKNRDCVSLAVFQPGPNGGQHQQLSFCVRE